jgi:hypothetical protein
MSQLDEAAINRNISVRQIGIQFVLHNNKNSKVCAAKKETEFHTTVFDRRGSGAVPCVLLGIIEMELKK